MEDSKCPFLLSSPALIFFACAAGNESADVTGINTTLGDTTTLDIGNGSDESHLEGKTNAPKREDSTSSIHSQGSA